MRRVLDWLLRHLVRWLRRRRYARMAERIRALEIGLGMVPDFRRSFFANGGVVTRERLVLPSVPTLIRMGFTPDDMNFYDGPIAYWTDEARTIARDSE